MEEFDFYFEQKAAVWFRTHFSIKAKDAEEAREKAKKFILRGDHTNYSWDQGDEIELLPVHMNCDQPTEELYEQTSGDIIWDNTQFDQ
jgi:hypothetical protein